MLYKCHKCKGKLLDSDFPSYTPYDNGQYIRVDVNCYYVCDNCNYSGFYIHQSLEIALDLAKDDKNIIYKSNHDIYVKNPHSDNIYILTKKIDILID